MTKKELKEMVASYISGQGTQLGVSDKIDDVLNGIIDILPSDDNNDTASSDVEYEGIAVAAKTVTSDGGAQHICILRVDNTDGKRGWPKNKYFMCRIIANLKAEDGSDIGYYRCGFLGYIHWSDRSYNDIIAYPAKQGVVGVIGVSTHEGWEGTEPYPEPWDIDVTLAINDSNIKNHLSSVEYRVFYKLI